MATSLDQSNVSNSLALKNGNESETQSETNSSLQQQLESLRAEKSTLEGQYGALLGKLTTMRNTLGDKLRQDADELDRREQQISQLQIQNEELHSGLESLKNEIIISNEEQERLEKEIHQLRSRQIDSQKLMEEEHYEREEVYRESREELEMIKNQLEDSKRDLVLESLKREQAESKVQSMENVISSMSNDLKLLKEDRDMQAESASNLQSVLEEFQAAKDSEISNVVSETQNRLVELETELALYKQKASAAEAKLAATQSDTVLCESLKKELKEKNILIGKIRHEAVILNEHLTEALRRLRRDTAEHSVDRRLVTNVLLSFITTPRADTKRFEMLSLLATILSWNDDQRQQVGLQKATPGTSRTTRNGPIAKVSSDLQRTSLRSDEDDTLGDGDTFTDQWVSFLLREANSSTPTPTPTFKSFSSPIHPSSSSSSSNSITTHKPSDQLHSPGSSSLSTLSALTRPTSELL
ncbi:uncharacterized protein MELLADRAFT_73614 [Melampsora larici-populina 98AG31]|uniref:GRIP domain-containing protein n=1 Tax=Melampsora larici-populina (strain 98AG31 / pathotype 3-4-7) TaxID=747676 RepID=F4SAF8_MELLP|nr:uncharacterized protein MELLADRAFT_73614 [Melampsora larici-populina 98AG31]EGF98381.1 hypothetical protein MELLADRAFT_73614 [Melampsora larici-populina 98AG31]